MTTQKNTAGGSANERKSARDWLATPDYAGIEILDPDGWRDGTGTTLDTPISRTEMDVRLGISTLRITREALKRIAGRV